MWGIDYRKARAQSYLRSAVQSSITNITDEDNRIRDIVAALNNAVSGSVYDADLKLIENCQRTLQELSSALHLMYLCLDYIEQLDIWEEDYD